MKRNEGNIILSSLNDVEMDFNRETTIPEGYIEVRLSTKGRVGAPKVIHVRNFKVKDIVALSLTQDSSLPAKLISILNDMIYEDVDVALWHEKEVEELMVYIYSSFYKDVLMDVDFPLTEEDIQELLKKPNGKELVAAIKTGENRPKTDIVISQGVDTWDIEDDFTPVVTITNKKSRYITLPDKVTPRLFNNLEVAKNSASIIMPDRRVEYYIKLGNNILIDIDASVPVSQSCCESLTADGCPDLCLTNLSTPG